MSRPVSPVSNENHVPEGQTVHPKSVGRTPLRALGILDPNSLNNQRISLSKSPNSTHLIKETPNVCIGAPTGLKAAASTRLESTSIQSSSLESKIPQNKWTEPACKMKCDHTGQLAETDFVSLSQNQQEFHENKDVNCLDVDCNTLTILPSDGGDKGSTEKKYESGSTKNTDCQEAGISSDVVSPICLDSSSEMRSGCPPEMIPHLHKVPAIDQENTESSLSEALHSVVEQAGLEFTSLTPEDYACLLIQDEDQAKVVSANSTFVKSSYFNDELDPCLLSLLSGDISHLVSKVDDLSFFENGNEGSLHVVSPIYDSLECIPQIESPAPSLPDDLPNAYKSEPLVDYSSAFWDSAVVLDKPDSLISHDILADGCSQLLDADEHTDKLTVNEDSSCNIKNSTDNGLESPNKCFTPIRGSTPCSEHLDVTEREIVKATSHQGCPDAQSEEADALDRYCCPTPVVPPKSSTTDHVSLGKRAGNKITPRVLSSFNDCSTSTTPVTASNNFTWVTPILHLNKSMNTSWNLKGKGERSARDNACETDSLLWNFSRESFCNATREQLMDRLEGALIVVEALSKQLQGWQQQTVSSKPSEQRDCSTQTCITYSNEAEQYYHNLYLNTLSQQQSLQRGLEDEKQLHQLLKEAKETLSLYKGEAAAMVSFAENLYEQVQQDRAALNQKVKCSQTLLADYITALSNIRCKVKAHLLEMQAQMKKALLEKEAADQCLKDLQVHSSDVISQLRRDLETERQLCDVVKDLYQQQHSHNEELEEFVQRALSVFCEVEDDRIQLRTQCAQAKELMSRHWHLFNIMKEKTQMALEEYEGIKNERDMAVMENQQMCCQLEDLASQNKQLELENSRLGSELESLMKTVCNLETDLEQWRLENAELSEKLHAKDLSSKLLEKELNEATERGLEYQDRIKYLSAEVVPSLEHNLLTITSQKEILQAQLHALKKEHASQIASFKESLEFLEQENEVCREQVQETESQLKTHHLNLLERNYQCENLKDSIKELEKDLTELKEKLADTETGAQNTKAKMDKEILEASAEVSRIKENLLDVIKSLKESFQREVNVASIGQQTSGGNLSLSCTSMEESPRVTVLDTTGSNQQRVEGIWSDKSAFTIVQPPSCAGAPVIKLADMLHDLGSIVFEVVTASSFAMDTKKHIVRDLKMDISSLREELQSQRFQHKIDVRDVQEEAEKLKRKICVLDEKLSSKEKYIKGLQELVQQHEKKILQQLEKVTENEDLVQENTKLKLSLKLLENEVEVLKAALAQGSNDSAGNWVQEKQMLHKDLIIANMKLSDMEDSKAEIVQRLMKHKDILIANLARSEAEVRKLDDIVEKIREVLNSIPDVVGQCNALRQLTEFLN